MIYKFEIKHGEDSFTIRISADKYMYELLASICEYLDLQDENPYIIDELNEVSYAVNPGKKSINGFECIDASAVKIKHVMENIGDVMTFHIGYSLLKIRLKGILF